MSSNSMLQTTSMTTMLRVARMVRTRKMMEMDLHDTDYAGVKRWRERQPLRDTFTQVSKML
jgi:hypothetical protein